MTDKPKRLVDGSYTTSATARDVPTVPDDVTYVSLPPVRPHATYTAPLPEEEG